MGSVFRFEIRKLFRNRLCLAALLLFLVAAVGMPGSELLFSDKKGDINSDQQSVYIELAEQYESYIQGIVNPQEAAQTMIHVKKDDYAARVAEKTARIYKRMEGKTLEPSDPKGAQMAFGGMADVILICGFAVMICGFLFQYEKEQKAEALLHSARRGRTGVYLGKLQVAFAGTALYSILELGSRILWGEFQFGLGDLQRPIQTVPDYYACAWELTVGEGLLLNSLVKILGAFLIILLCAGIYTRLDGAAAWAAICGMFVISYGMYAFIQESSVFQPLRYMNLFAVFQTELFCRAAVYLKIGSYPFSFYWAAGIFACLMIGTGLWAGLGKRGQLRKSAERKYKVKERKKTASLQELEWKKLLVPQYGYLIVIGCLLLQGMFIRDFYGGTGSEEQLYRLEMEKVEGEYSESKNVQIQERYQEMLDNPAMYQDAQIRSMERLAERSAYLQKQSTATNVSYVYERGYESLVGVWKVGWRYQPFLMGTAVLLLLAGIFACEKEYGMENLCQTTAGWYGMGRRKIKMAFATAGILFGINWLPETIFILRTFPFTANAAAAVSIPRLAEVPKFFSLTGLIFWVWGIRVVGSVIFTVLLLWISENSSSYFQGVLKGGIFWGMQAALYFVLPEQWKLFSLAGMMGGEGGWVCSAGNSVAISGWIAAAIVIVMKRSRRV